jgi:RimJ/RimL family protein N-acetyltransferase
LVYYGIQIWQKTSSPHASGKEDGPMEIKKATKRDIRDISWIHAASWKSAYVGLIPQQFLDELKEDRWVATFTKSLSWKLLTVQLAYDRDQPVGCISYGRSRDESLPDWGEIVSFYLLPQYWGKGFAKALLETALTDLRKSYRNVFLWVLKDNARARKFYEKNRFRCNDDEGSFEIMGKDLVDVRYVYSFRNLSLKV